MKHLLFSCMLGAMMAGCGAGDGFEIAETPEDAGTEFIRATLDGDHARARFFLLRDSVNLVLMERQQRDYDQLSLTEKRDHRESTIRVLALDALNDSVSAFTYYSTHNPADTTTLTIVRRDGAWLVDLKSILEE